MIWIISIYLYTLRNENVDIYDNIIIRRHKRRPAPSNIISVHMIFSFLSVDKNKIRSYPLSPRVSIVIITCFQRLVYGSPQVVLTMIHVISLQISFWYFVFPRK